MRSGQTASEKQFLDPNIAFTDQQIGALVYELYGLTKEEIKTSQESGNAEP
jgi:hypothetical protein